MRSRSTFCSDSCGFSIIDECVEDVAVEDVSMAGVITRQHRVFGSRGLNSLDALFDSVEPWFESFTSPNFPNQYRPMSLHADHSISD